MKRDRPIVLVVDDHPENITLVATNLKLEDYAVETAGDGAECVRKALQVKPDLILLDLMMPVMDGLEACRVLRRNPLTQRIPIILMTAKSRLEDIVEGLECGADDYVRKPFHIAELLSRVRSAMRMRAMQDELSDLNDSLERRIRERTRELEQSRQRLHQRNAALIEALSHLESLTTQLKDEREKAEAATRAKSEFMANMSHEIRTPMTAILGYAEILRSKDYLSQAPPEHIEAIEAIHRNGEFLLSIINDILDLSKIEAGKMTAERIECSPQPILADVASLMRVRADSKELDLSIEYAGPLPRTIRTDPVRLRQILINLVGNAIKFTETGGVRLVMKLSVPPDTLNPLLRIEVIDTGVGMTEDQLATIFQPFQQADTSTTRKFGGTGLGLAISMRLAKLLGGGINVESTPDVGSSFMVTIDTGPLNSVEMIQPGDELLAPPRPRPKHPAAQPDCRRLQGARVLVVEDGPDNQRLFGLLLKRAGASSVDIAENGRIACAKVLDSWSAGDPYDVILMDMQMPEMDGYTATRVLREKGYAGPIIALTAHAGAGSREKCLDAGCDDYASKPIDQSKLIDLMGAAIEASKAPSSRRAGRPGMRRASA